jgi:hypothetical protein
MSVFDGGDDVETVSLRVDLVCGLAVQRAKDTDMKATSACRIQGVIIKKIGWFRHKSTICQLCKKGQFAKSCADLAKLLPRPLCGWGIRWGRSEMRGF